MDFNMKYTIFCLNDNLDIVHSIHYECSSIYKFWKELQRQCVKSNPFEKYKYLFITCKSNNNAIRVSGGLAITLTDINRECYMGMHWCYSDRIFRHPNLAISYQLVGNTVMLQIGNKQIKMNC